MSVWVFAILSHRWPTISQAAMGELQYAIFPKSTEFRWQPISECGSYEFDFTNYGSAYFRLSDGFSLRFARKLIGLKHDDRWSALLMHREVRQSFVSACKRVALVTGAEGMLLLPELTELDDSLGDDIDFAEIKRLASVKFGPPDLDISRFYTENEVIEMARNRVHYFAVRL